MPNQIDLSIIEEFSNANGVSGFEDEVLQIARKFAPVGSSFSEDSLRNLYIFRKEHHQGKPVIQLDAHSDEVGFMVHAIKPDGTLRFISLGNWIVNNIPAHKVRVQNADGVYIPESLLQNLLIFLQIPAIVINFRSNSCPSISEHRQKKKRCMIIRFKSALQSFPMCPLNTIQAMT